MRRAAQPALALVLVLAFVARGDEPAPAWGEPKKLCDLADREIKESSGLAASRTCEGVFWTHNDSGDEARLFAVDREGATRATFLVEGVRADDWEDLCAFTWRERPYLLVADTGDNDSEREHVLLHLLEEPRSLPPAGATGATLRARQTLRVRYEDGPHDCEGVGVDGTSGAVLLVTKERTGGKPRVFTFDLTAARGEGAAPIVARPIATLDVPSLTTALDVSPDGRLAIVLTYGDAYVWSRGEDEAWGDAFARAPLRVTMPARRQGESICFGADGRSLFLTSEKLPAPLWELPRR